MSETFLRIASIEEQSSIYGPGLRFVIWVQGCTLACKGCWNTSFWPKKGGYDRTVESLVKQIIETEQIEGITILGGEPLEQAEAVHELLQLVKEAGLSTFLYSGFENHELNGIQQACIKASDIVVLGRYIEEKRDVNLRWRGSSNQIIEFPSERYRGIQFEERGECEVILEDDGSIRVLGYPDPELIAFIKSMN
uniref:Anaerobic ribonucleoside-triphosphate reductase activating protein (NrdG) n=1 Tax=uncultured marine group II/III euryarchaeote KM3_26_H05 TaxID=1456427 RepID=A0A075H0Q1_9EURY|nr:anaerobic ribonucleoside-triphosphate reductase activating protein (nrdG) [uncultured marine group II/III euryarchaeote KM3_26_H05]